MAIFVSSRKRRSILRYFTASRERTNSKKHNIEEGFCARSKHIPTTTKISSAFGVQEIGLVRYITRLKTTVKIQDFYLPPTRKQAFFLTFSRYVCLSVTIVTMLSSFLSFCS